MFSLFGVLHRINSISIIQQPQFTNPCFLDYFKPALNQSIILTLAGQSLYYSHRTNPERQGEKPQLPVLKTLLCRSRGSNPPPTHEADTLTTIPPQQL